jgi:hypothetical protein
VFYNSATAKNGRAFLIAAAALVTGAAFHFLEAGPAPKTPLVQFSNVTKAAGIDFVHFKGENGISTILEEAGPGVCVADYDGDGYQDIYFVNGRDRYGRGVRARNALYRKQWRLDLYRRNG